MASIQKKGNTFYCQFIFQGRRRTVTVGRVSASAADAFAARAEELLALLKRGRLTIPLGMDITDFVLRDGRPPDPEMVPAHEVVIFADFKAKYLETHRHGAMEPSSLYTAEIHLGHFERSLGAAFPVGKVTLGDLQRHINDRAKKKYRGKSLSPTTLRKEIATFRAAWNWGALHGLIGGPFPAKGLVYPKDDEKPPFMTWAEIERRVALGGLTTRQLAELWDCLYLRKEEIDQLLEHVRTQATAPWLYPMVATAAFTGARRSELLRMEVADVDFEGSVILVREKKRSRKARTTRHVSLTPALAAVLKDWLAIHPGGKHLFCQAGVVPHSRKRSRTTGHQGEKTRQSSQKGRRATVRPRGEQAVTAVTRDEAHDHLKRTLAGSKWEVLKGYHVLRHSFISCLAAAGVDQRIIDDFVGHQTDEQRRRYRHLVPNVKQQALAGVFG